jgi:hypothetical protein
MDTEWSDGAEKSELLERFALSLAALALCATTTKATYWQLSLQKVRNLLKPIL